MRLRKVVLLCCLMGISMTGFATEKMIDKAVYGRYESVKVVGLDDILVPAKLDTGAWTASLNATDIEVFKKDGKDWVRFTPQIKDEKFTPLERPLVKMGRIKRRAADVDKAEKGTEDKDKAYTYRPEVEMQICMGDQLKTIRVNLTDRSSFRYPLLLGAKALRQFEAVVDPGLKYQSKSSCAME